MHRTILLPLQAITCKGMLNVAKVQYKLRLSWYGSMKWNMEKNFIMEWKIFSMEWKKIASMEYGKIALHSIPCPVQTHL